jgi:hypothetical protein
MITMSVDPGEHNKTPLQKKQQKERAADRAVS